MEKKLLLLALLIVGAVSEGKETSVVLEKEAMFQEILYPEIREAEIIEEKSNKEVLIFTNGQYLKAKNKKIKDINFKLKDLIPPVIEPEIPELPKPPVVEPEIPELPKPPVVEPEIPELPKPPVVEPEIPKPPKPPVKPEPPKPIIWEEGVDVLEKVHATDRNLETSVTYSALKGVQGAKITNNFEIKVEGNGIKGIEIDKSYANNKGDIKVDKGSAFHLTNSYAENNGNIDVTLGVGFHLKDVRNVSVKGLSQAANKGLMNISEEGLGADIRDGKFVNEGTINVKNSSTGIYTYALTTGVEVSAINKGTINVDGDQSTGMFFTGRYLKEGVNEGDIILTNNGTGMHVQGSNEKNKIKGINNGNIIGTANGTVNNAVDIHTADFENNGKIEVDSSSSIVVSFANSGNLFTNNGEILIKKGRLSTGARDGSIILNNGNITSHDSYLDLTSSKFVQGATGTITAKEVIGDITLASEISKDNYNSEFTKEFSIEKHNGNVLSESFLYNVSANKLEDKYEVKLTKKDFKELINNRGVANYLENNYIKTDNLLKDKFYNEIRNKTNIVDLNKTTNAIFGNEILPNINKQTLDLVKFTKDTLKNNVFDSNTTKEIRTIAGYEYKKNEVKASNLAGYSQNINYIFLGADKEINSNLRFGGVMTLGAIRSNYSAQNAKRKDSNLQANIFTQYKRNGLNNVFNGFIGGTNGSLERNIQLDIIDSKLSTNLESRYIGFNNILSKKIDKNGFILEPQAQINGTYLKTSGVDESGEYGIKTSKEDIKSFEVGTGITLEKAFATNKYLIIPQIGANYFYEFGSPYKAFDGQILDISTDKFEISKNSISRGRTELLLGVNIEKGNLKISGDYKYLLEREESLLSAGLSYKFN